MTTELVKKLKEAGITAGTDGLLISCAGQENRNDQAVIDCINTAIERYEKRAEALMFIRDDILMGRV